MVGIDKYLVFLDGTNEVYKSFNSFREAIACANVVESMFGHNVVIYMKVYSDGKVEQNGKK